MHLGIHLCKEHFLSQYKRVVSRSDSLFQTFKSATWSHSHESPLNAMVAPFICCTTCSLLTCTLGLPATAACVRAGVLMPEGANTTVTPSLGIVTCAHIGVTKAATEITVSNLGQVPLSTERPPVSTQVGIVRAMCTNVSNPNPCLPSVHVINAAP